MDYSVFNELIKKPLFKHEVLHLAKAALAQHNLLKKAVEISAGNQQQGAIRASWMISHAFDLEPSTVLSYLNDLVKISLETPLESVRRIYLRIIANTSINEAQAAQLIDPCLRWMMSESQPVAVRCNALQVVSNICVTEPLLAREVIVIIQELEEFGSPAFKSKSRQVLKRLKKISNDQID